MVQGESEKIEYFLIEKVKMHNDMTAIIKLRQIPLEEKSTRVDGPPVEHHDKIVLHQHRNEHNKGQGKCSERKQEATTNQ